MPTFKKNNKKAAKRKAGSAIIQRKNKPGFYIRWYVLREKPADFDFTSDKSKTYSEEQKE